MNCYIHNDISAVGKCVDCGQLICEDCAIRIDNKIYCKSCIAEKLSTKLSNSQQNNPSQKSLISVITAVIGLLISIYTIFNGIQALVYTIKNSHIIYPFDMLYISRIILAVSAIFLLLSSIFSLTIKKNSVKITLGIIFIFIGILISIGAISLINTSITSKEYVFLKNIANRYTIQVVIIAVSVIVSLFTSNIRKK